MELPLDYEMLRIIWWGLLGIILIGFAVTDGFDMGVGALLPFVARTDGERRITINTIGPVWEGNQVWLVLGGGAIFAAFPLVYAVSFSGFYLAMFATLLALILRPVAFKYRSKRADPRWRAAWDWALFIGGFVPALIFGVAVGNALQGVPFRFDDTLRMTYEGDFWGLLNPFALLCGLTSVSMLVLHGAAWLGLKADDPVRARARTIGMIAAPLSFLLFALGGVWILQTGMGYALQGAIDPNTPSNPHLFDVSLQAGAWLANYETYPWMITAPVIGLLGAVIAFAGLWTRSEPLAFTGSSLSTAGIIASVGASMYPFILPSSLDPGSSLTAWSASSSHLTLFVMLIVTVIFLPIVLAYTAWAFKVMWGRVSADDINRDPHTVY
jgi:cytochrome d ubiquinol oxidase subunit II